MKLHRDLEVTQKSAWHLAHRLRKAFEGGESQFSGPVMADEIYIEGKRKNTSEAKRAELLGTEPSRWKPMTAKRSVPQSTPMLTPRI